PSVIGTRIAPSSGRQKASSRPGENVNWIINLREADVKRLVREKFTPRSNDLDSSVPERKRAGNDCLREHLQSIDQPRARPVEVGIAIRQKRAAVAHGFQPRPVFTLC